MIMVTHNWDNLFAHLAASTLVGFGRFFLTIWAGVYSVETYPIGSMYGIFTYIWLISMGNVGKYTIHGSYGYGNSFESTSSNRIGQGRKLHGSISIIFEKRYLQQV